MPDLPDEVEACVRSVKSDNDISKSEAIAICRDQLDMREDGDDCPEGHAQVAGDCIPINTVENVPPSSFNMSDHRVLANRRLAGPIEREELGENEVRYTNVALLDRGVWTDAGSGQPTEYDPAELEVKEDNSVNIMHDSESESSEAGYIEADSYYVEDGTGYADIVLDVSKSAGQYADDNLQETLESGGQVGFGGPSIEIPAEGYDLKDTGNGYPKLVDGVIEGMGFVKDPASRSTSFARQTAERGVAMSAADGQSPMVYLQQDGAMSDETDKTLADAETVREVLEGNGIDTGEMTDEEVMAIGEELMAEYAEDEEEDEEDMENQEEPEDEEPEDEPPEEDPDDEEDEVNVDIEALQSEVAELRSEVEAMREAMMEAEAVEEQLSDVREELAAADTVQELEEAKDDLEKRLAALEDQPKPPKSMSDDGDGSDWEPTYDTTPSEPASW